MFSDRIELYSPGALPNGMRLDEIACKQNARNPAIANLLKRCAVADGIVAPRCTMMDRRGAGVPAILARSRRLSGRQPVYELFGDELRLTIYAADPRRRPGVAEQADPPPWRHRSMSILDASLRKTWDSLRARKQVQNDFLDEVRLKGLRGMRSLRVAFDYPVSVIAGPNGVRQVHGAVRVRGGVCAGGAKRPHVHARGAVPRLLGRGAGRACG